MILFRNNILLATIGVALIARAHAEPLQLSSFSRAGDLVVTNTASEAVLTLERSVTLPIWKAARSAITTSNSLALQTSPTNSVQFYRARSLPIPPTAEGFSNLTQSFNTLETIAGTGLDPAAKNKWKPEFEGAPATQVELSRPHIAMADRSGNIFIADKEGHAIRKIRPDGTIMTVAGTGLSGNGPDGPTPGTSVALTQPNGLWVGSKGIVYILDLGNGKVRKLGPSGNTRTVFTVPGGIVTGRGIWMRDDETLAYLCSGSEVKKWTPTEGVTTFASGFNSLGNLAIDPNGHLVVTDRGGNLVVRFEADGTRKVIAGNGATSGGGDGQPALQTGLAGVRAIWFLPTGAYFLGTEVGGQIWYVDTAGIIHLFLNGNALTTTHSGDGTWFYAPNELRTSLVKQITLDPLGNMLITENDAGFVRKITFLPHQ